MGKRFKKKFGNIFCLGKPSSDLQIGIYEKQTKPTVPRNPKKTSKKEMGVEILRQEVEELGEKLKSLKEAFDEVEEKYKTTEREIGEFFGESVVEKIVAKLAYSAPPMMVHKERMSGNDIEISISSRFSPSIGITDKNEKDLYDTRHSPLHINVEATTKEVGTYQVPSLAHYGRRMFYQVATNSEDAHENKRFLTDLAMRYNLVALQNISSTVIMSGRKDNHLLSLRKICYKLLVQENTVDPLQDKDPGDLLEISGSFGHGNTEVCSLEREKEQLKEINFLDISGLAKTIQPLQSMQVVLHHEILTTLNFPFRVTLRDVMLRNKFEERHAQFLCVNLLITLKHLHSLNIIHGHISPSKVILTQFGYPCLTGVGTSEIDDDAFKPKVRIDYTSPEQVKAEPITEATDVFQTGVLVYSMIYGKSPFKGNTYFKTRSNLLDENFTPGIEHDTFTKDGRYFIRKLLKLNPSDRFQLDRCKKPLDKAVRWLSTFNEQELLRQTYPSPFREPIMREILAE